MFNDEEELIRTIKDSFENVHYAQHSPQLNHCVREQVFPEFVNT